MKRAKVFESEVWSAVLWVMLGLMFALLASLAYGGTPTDSARVVQPQDRRVPHRAGPQPKAISEVGHSAPGSSRHSFEAAQQRLRQSTALHADQARAMTNLQARARLAHLTGPNDAVAGVPRSGRPGSPMHDVLPGPKAAVTRNALIGGPRAQNSGSLGRAVGRTNYGAAIDGRQLQRHH